MGLYCALYMGNILFPMPMRWMWPESSRDTLINLRLLGKVEVARYDTGDVRFIKRHLPQSSSWIYGTMYEPYGEWVSYAPDGTVASRIRFPDPTGRWIEWHENGNRKQEINYRVGEFHGKWCVWYRDGQKEWLQEYLHGKMHGLERMWYENGRLYLEYRYRDGRRVGVGSEWHPNGRTKSTAQYGDDGYMLEQCWREDGTKESREEYVNSRKHGQSIYWNQDGVVILTESYEGGKLHGKREKFFPDGSKWLEQSYDANEPNGIWVSYSPDGQILSRLTFPGANGLWVEYVDANTNVKTRYIDGIGGPDNLILDR